MPIQLFEANDYSLSDAEQLVLLKAASRDSCGITLTDNN
jgi:hypothetical protein